MINRAIHRTDRLIPAALCVAIALACGAAPLQAVAQGQARGAATTQRFDIGPGSLADALSAYGAQSGMHVVYQPELVSGKSSRGVSGEFTAAEALRRVLDGSGLTSEAINASTVTLRQGAPAERSPGNAPARNDPGTRAADGQPEVTDIQGMSVTGTRIRGGATSSPVIAIGAVQIREEGFTDLGQLARSIPQNYGGGQNPGVIPFNIAGAGTGNSNVTGGSGLNLRGLGADATLTLLNGRRMAYGGFVQAVDISAIPVEAVERVEIVADGASAIYGSDAVGGVANVILKRDVDGFALGTRYGTATDGGLTTHEYTATAGGNWGSGGLIATYKDVSADPIYARQRDYTQHLLEPYTIYPKSDQRSGLLSAYQSVGAIAELRLDALRTERDQMYTMHINVGNQQTLVTSNTATSLVAPALEFFLPNDWTVSLGGAWGKDEHDQLQTITSAATGNVLTSTNDCLCNESRMYEVGAEGPLFVLPGGEARLAVGGGYRTNEFRQVNHLSNTLTVQGDDSSRFAYAELNLPLLGPQRPDDTTQRLVLSAAVRAEDYDTFGSVATPKLGLIYGPSNDFTLKASWGKSFKAPTLMQMFREQMVSLRLAGAAEGYPEGATELVSYGGNRDLQPERARTWTASLAVHPEAIPGLEVELSWFDVDYTDRVVEPVNWSLPLADPANAEFVTFYPTAEAQAAFIAAADSYSNGTGQPYDPNRVVAIVRSHFVNATEQRIRGLDLTGSYRTDIGAGQLTLRGSASWLQGSQQTTDITAFDLAGTLHNPPRLAGRIGAAWTQSGFTASTFANYKSGVRNVIHDEKTASFTTLDATLRYAANQLGTPWSGWDFAFSVQNLLDRAPPLHTLITPFLVPPYDATNYSAISRFLSVSVSKHW